MVGSTVGTEIVDGATVEIADDDDNDSIAEDATDDDNNVDDDNDSIAEDATDDDDSGTESTAKQYCEKSDCALLLLS